MFCHHEKLLNVASWALKALANYNGRPFACFPGSFSCVVLNIVAFTVFPPCDHLKGKKKPTSAHFKVYLCLKKHWTIPRFSSKAVSHTHTDAHSRSHSCLFFWALCLLSLLLQSRLFVCVCVRVRAPVALFSAHFRHSCVPWEGSLLQCLYRQSLSLCLSVGATYSVFSFSLNAHGVCESFPPSPPMQISRRPQSVKLNEVKHFLSSQS